jgi:hypothetical protein
MALDNAQLHIVGNGQAPPAARTERKDTWWLEPAATGIVLLAFIGYATWRIFEAANYQGGPYLSPFYSPLLFTNWRLGGIALSPALFIMPFPALFRGTCYYYRKAYYRAFFWDPPACAVVEPARRPHYTGEREFPFTLQNLHRDAFYIAVIFIVILGWDVVIAFWYQGRFFVGIGSLIMLVNWILITLYTFSCHSWRHLIGGQIDCFSCSAANITRHGIWEKVSHFNENHALWAWLSLFSMVLTDLYIREVSLNVLPVGRIF